MTTRQRLQSLVGDEQANAITAGLGSQSGQLASLGLLRRAGAARHRRDRPGDVQPQLRAPRLARVRDLRPAAGGGPGLDRPAAGGAAHRGHRHRALLRAAGGGPRRRLADAGLRPSAAGAAAAVAARPLGADRPGPGARPVRGDPLLLGAARPSCCKAGELTGLGEDIFFLDGDEIVAVLDGREPDLAAISRRRDDLRALPGAAGLPGPDPRPVRPVRLGRRPGPADRPLRPTARTR